MGDFVFVDTHCHLDSADFGADLAEVLAAAAAANVGEIIIPGAAPKDLPRAMEIAQNHDGVRFCAGIHPNEVENFDEAALAKVLARLEAALKHPKCAAVGEVGLDFHYFDANDPANLGQIEAQKAAFIAQIRLAVAHKKPLIIHTRDSNAPCVEILREFSRDLRAVIFHCFGGDLALGGLACPTFYGIGGVVSFKNAKNLRESLPKLPLDSLLLETDAPYLAPTPHRGARNEPRFIPLIAAHLAETLNLGVEKIAKITTENARRAFG